MFCDPIIEYRSVTSFIFVFAFQHFHDYISVKHDVRLSHTKFDMNWFTVPEIWPHEYLIVNRHIEISVNCPGSISVMNWANLH